MTAITWYRVPTNIYNGNLQGANPDGGWYTDDIWWTGNSTATPYFSFIFNEFGSTSKSIISTNLCPFFKIINAVDEDDILGTFGLVGYYNGEAVWRDIGAGNSMIYQSYHSGYTLGYIMVTPDEPSGNYYYVGYIPDSNTPYWTVAQNLMQGNARSDLLADGTATAQGTATKNYVIKAYWPRWELDGYGNEVNRGWYPKTGVYQPVDGAAGTMTFGIKDDNTDSYVMSWGKSRNHVMGQVVTWQ